VEKLEVTSPYYVEPLSDGHYLLSGYRSGRVQEVDAAGNTVWRCDQPDSSQATRLRNGNTLVLAGTFPGARLLEIDPAGNTVSEIFLERAHVQQCLGLVRLGFDGPRPAGLDLSTSIPYRLKGLKSKDGWKRYFSAYELQKLGPRALGAVPDLIEALDDPDERVRGAAWGALRSVGPQVIPDLRKALKDNRPNVRAGAVGTLGQFQQEGKAAVPELIEALRDESVLVRRNAAWALGRIGPASKGAVLALADALKDPDRRKTSSEACVSQWAALSLGVLGPLAKPAIPALVDALKGDDLELRCLALSTLGRIGPEAKGAVPAILEAFETKDVANPRLAPLIRRAAISALGQIGDGAESVLSAIAEALHADDEETRSEAAKASKKIRQNRPSRRAVPVPSRVPFGP